MADTVVNAATISPSGSCVYQQAIAASTNNFVFNPPAGKVFKSASLQVNGTWNGKTMTVKESSGNSYSEALQDATPANITFTADAVKILLTDRPCGQIILNFSDATGVSVTAILLAETI